MRIDFPNVIWTAARWKAHEMKNMKIVEYNMIYPVVAYNEEEELFLIYVSGVFNATQCHNVCYGQMVKAD